MIKLNVKKSIIYVTLHLLLILIGFIISYTVITTNRNNKTNTDIINNNTNNFYIVSVLKNDSDKIQYYNNGAVLSPKEIHVYFNDNSYAILEPEKNEYLFQYVNLNDWAIETSNFKDIINIMATYTGLTYENILKEIDIPDYNLINDINIKDQLI